MKHITLGGFWHDAKTQQWVRAGSEISRYIEQHSDLQHFLGVHKAETRKPGEWNRFILSMSAHFAPYQLRY